MQEKAVLKQAVSDLLPPAIVHRPKSGMMVPVQLNTSRLTAVETAPTQAKPAYAGFNNLGILCSLRRQT